MPDGELIDLGVEEESEKLGIELIAAHTRLQNLAEARTGTRAEAIKMLDRLTELSKQRYIPAYYFAIVYAGLEQKDRAFAELEKAFQERPTFSSS